MKNNNEQQQQQEQMLECPFTSLSICLKQTKQSKMDMSICTNCLLGRIEKHLYALVKKAYRNESRRYKISKRNI